MDDKIKAIEELLEGLENGIKSTNDVDEKLQMVNGLLKSFEEMEIHKDKEDCDSVKLDKECRENNVSYENLGPIMTMEDAIAKLDKDFPDDIDNLDEGEEIIWEWPETPEEKKLREELIDDLEANILIESVMRVQEAKQKEKELEEAKFLIKQKEDELEILKKKIGNDS